MAKIPTEFFPVPELDRPLFVMAFKGLFDMGEAATAAIDWLSMAHGGHPAAAIDPEPLFDFQEVRPEVRIGVNGTREILWPANNVVWARTPEGSRDLVLLSGVEPSLRWRSFGRCLTDIVQHTGADLIVTLGSTLAMTPHTRAFPVQASTADGDLAELLGIARPSYEGPTGVIGSIHHELGAERTPLISLQVSIPHYVPGPPSPKATGALLAGLEQLLGVPTNHAGLADEIRDWESRVHRALSDDDEVRAYVEDLESTADTQPDVVFGPQDLASEIESFLRKRHEN
ncbi:MAG: PAC2 family protein [Acidimicrobiia bacterium]|nr:PAC2 family protein [Acidimicrobiia bacterium]